MTSWQWGAVVVIIIACAVFCYIVKDSYDDEKDVQERQINESETPAPHDET